MELNSLEIQDRAKLKLDQIVEELREFVSVESHTFDISGVNAVADILCERLVSIGFTVSAHNAEGYGQHRIARLSGSGSGRALVLLHLDTVWPQGTLETWPVQIDGDQITGPGVLDMKGGWIVLLETLRLLHESGWTGFKELVVYMGSDEQVGSPLGRKIVQDLARDSDWAFGMEPAPILDTDAVVVRRAAVGGFYVDVTGIGAHPVSGTTGVSAILEASRIISDLHQLADPSSGRFMNVGTIEGGTSRQVAAAHATLSVGFRARETAEAQELVAKAREILAHNRAPGSSATMRDLTLTNAYPSRTPESQGLFDEIARTAQVLGVNLNANEAMGAADSSHATATGIPAIDGLGPEGGNSCAPGEYVTISSLPRRIAMLSGLFASLSKGSPPRQS